jgi:hypothetical protein
MLQRSAIFEPFRRRPAAQVAALCALIGPMLLAIPALALALEPLLGASWAIAWVAIQGLTSLGLSVAVAWVLWRGVRSRRRLAGGVSAASPMHSALVAGWWCVAVFGALPLVGMFQWSAAIAQEELIEWDGKIRYVASVISWQGGRYTVLLPAFEDMTEREIDAGDADARLVETEHGLALRIEANEAAHISWSTALRRSELPRAQSRLRLTLDAGERLYWIHADADSPLFVMIRLAGLKPGWQIREWEAGPGWGVYHSSPYPRHDSYFFLTRDLFIPTLQVGFVQTTAFIILAVISILLAGRRRPAQAL